MAGKGLTLYPAQEEAILELFEGKNVILNTPTGSGKSLVASALHFASLAHGRRSVYTCPIKALVNEKWMALCRELGPENVGLSTGDATVNRDAPVLCCTAEVLANIALREGEDARVDDVVMDEFHWYADRDRGVAWQVPLLTLPQRALPPDVRDARRRRASSPRTLTRRNGRPTAVVKSIERPVPLEYAYSEIPLAQTLEKLVSEGKAPVYVVHFTQKDAADSAQDFTSLNLCTPRGEERGRGRDRRASASRAPTAPTSASGSSRGSASTTRASCPSTACSSSSSRSRACSRSSAARTRSGSASTCPIRTVLFSRLCKFDGQKTAVLSARDFHQIAGRAGRKGFDDLGFVVAQAPGARDREPPPGREGEGREEGRQAQAARAQLRELGPPDVQAPHGRAARSGCTSRFQVSHGMLLNVLSRRGDGCRAMQRLIRDSHEPDRAKKAHFKRAWQLFRALVERGIVEIVPPTREDAVAKVRVNVDLQDDFSMDQALSLYLLETIPRPRSRSRRRTRSTS